MRRFLPPHPLFDPVARERLLAFSRFLWHRFVDDKCFEAAGALSYTTVFALVPLAVAALGIMSAFPQFGKWSQQITDFIFANFVPSTGAAVQGYLTDAASKATQLTSVGIVGLVIGALLLMHSVEETFNRIWRAPARKRRMARLVVYWTVLTLGPLLAAGSLAVSAEVFGERRAEPWFSEVSKYALPVAVTWAGIALAYLVIPNAPIRARNVLFGSLLATIMFEASKHGFASFLARANYGTLYGPLSAVPVLLVWIYVSWAVVLLGASISASLSAFRFQPAALRMPPGLELAAFLRCLRAIATNAGRGTPLEHDQLAALQPGLTDEQLERFLELMRRLRLVQRTEQGALVPLRDFRSVPIREVFEAGHFRLPGQAEIERLRRDAMAQDAPLLAWFESALAPLSPTLAQSLATVVESAQPTPNRPSAPGASP
jgi:membrane protein